MTQFDPERIAAWANGEWSTSPHVPIDGFSIDTRTILKGEIFVAIEDKRDGHEFGDLALSKGASGMIARKFSDGLNLPQLLVQDTLEALQGIARGYRMDFECPVVGITGSCGKTSTKEILKVILGEEKTHSTFGNLNNHLGVPLTILSQDTSVHEFSVIEAGINQRDEMATLAKMIDPEYVIVTSIGNSHLEGLGTIEGVASEKAHLFEIPENPKRVFFGEDCLKFENFSNWVNQRKPCTVLKRGKPENKLSANEAYFNFWTETNKVGDWITLELWRYQSPPFSLSIQSMSEGMLGNLSLAILQAFELGVTEEKILERLPQYRPSALRGTRLQGRGRTYLIDCYNANPSSMLDTLDYFTREFADQPRLLVLGGMEELGSDEEKLHREIGESQQLNADDRVVLVGSKAGWMADGFLNSGARLEQLIPVREIEDARAVIEDFEGAVLFKGSRKNRLEELIPTWAVEPAEVEDLVASC